MQEKILILDFGSQVTQLIARRIREIGVYCEIWPYHRSWQEIQNFGAKGYILSGSPASVHDVESPRIHQDLIDSGTPILGICYGQQCLSHQLGGVVEQSQSKEFGHTLVEVVQDCPLIHGLWPLGSHQQVWMSHGDKVTVLPPEFSVIAKSLGAPFAMMAHQTKPIYGIQFHPEVAHTPDGTALIRNFVLQVCGCKADWTPQNFKDEMIEKIRIQVGDAKVLCALSGGVDSSVAAALIHQAIGDKLTCIFVDHGLLRKNEAEQVVKTFRDEFKIKLVHVQAQDHFLSKLAGVTDPEEKRKIIGREFIHIFEEKTKDLGHFDFLAQGTLYPDVIESVSVTGGPSVVIKSHHNVGGLPEKFNFKLLEPLRDLFKDEVRALGLELGLSKDSVYRHPFPGPGLAIRIPGEVTREKCELLREVDHVYITALKEAGLYDQIWQAFAVLLPVKTVGVMGDGRTYEYVCALRAVTSTDGMTADVYPFEAQFLTQLATRIINQCRGVNRVVYDFTTKAPGTIEWE